MGSGFLRFEHFRALLDENPQLQEIELANYGEIFLNPELLQIVTLAHERDVRLTADVGANLNDVRDEVAGGAGQISGPFDDLLDRRCVTDGLRESVNSETMSYARAMLQGQQPARDDIPCTTCEIYLGMRESGRWLDRGQRRRESVLTKFRKLGMPVSR